MIPGAVDHGPMPPKDKPRVERPMPYVRDSHWRGRTFTSLDHMQTEALLRARNVAGQRQCRPLDGAKPLSVFETVEAPAPPPLPETPFMLACRRRRVGPDIHIKVGRTLYSMPWKPIGRRVVRGLCPAAYEFVLARTRGAAPHHFNQALDRGVVRLPCSAFSR